MKKFNINKRNVQSNNIKLTPITLDPRLDGGRPPQVEGVNASPGDEVLVVSWNATIADPEVLTYCLRYRISPAGPWIPDDDGADVGNVTNFNILGLVNGTAYDVEVAAVNENGKGPFSVTVTETPEALPDQVMNVILTLPTDNQIHAEWDAVIASPTVDDYTLEYKETTDSIWIANLSTTDLFDDVTDPLLSGVQYDIRVAANNAVGKGPPSAVVQIIVEGVPEQPMLVAIGGIEQANLSWTEGTAAPPIGAILLELKLNSDSEWSTFGPLSHPLLFADIYALTDSLYDFRVAHANPKGVGPFSVIQQATPALIGSSLVLELNEKGISPANQSVAIDNTGTDGSSRDFHDRVGNTSNLTHQIHKAKPVWQSSGDCGLRANDLPAFQYGQPATIVWAGIPFLIDGNFRQFWESAFELSDSSSRNDLTSIFGGSTSTDGIPMDTSGTEWAYIGRFDQGNSDIRVFKNGGPNVLTNGSTFSNNIAIEILNWNSDFTATGDFAAQNFTLLWYNGKLSIAEVAAVKGAVEQKYFEGFPDIVPPPIELPLMLYRQEGIVSAGPGQPVTAWLNTGSSAGQNDYTVKLGAAFDLVQGTQNGHPVVQVNDDARLECVNPQAALTQPYTIYMAGRAFTHTGQRRFWFQSQNGDVSFTVDNQNHFVNAGVDLVNNTNGSFNNIAIAIVFDGINTRFVTIGGAIIDVVGDAGANAYQPQYLFWEDTATQFNDFQGLIFEKRVYDSAHDTAELQSNLTELAVEYNIAVMVAMQDVNGNVLTDDIGNILVTEA